jgi:hypothetical protein
METNVSPKLMFPDDEISAFSKIKTKLTKKKKKNPSRGQF